MDRVRKRILVGITGGIAAYKTPHFIRLLKKSNFEVHVVLTEAAKNLVGEDALRTVSGNPVFKDECSSYFDMNHITLAEWADYFIVCPATANTIAKISHGIADNLLTTLSLSFQGIMIVAPAMNSAMWNNTATRENIDRLKQRGVRILPVASGPLACGDEGPGRMLSPESLIDFVKGADAPQCLLGKKVLIASGPTVEPIDPVRILTNRSSGRMGATLACVSHCMGAEVTVVSGPAEIPVPEGIYAEYVQTCSEMAQHVHDHFEQSDICIMAAAVSDFRPESVSDKKISRTETPNLSLKLIPNPDIAYDLSRKKTKQFLLCFSLEMAHSVNRAIKKMNRKGCDMMVYNEVDVSLGKTTSGMTILYPQKKPQTFSVMDKSDCAKILMKKVAASLGLYHE